MSKSSNIYQEVTDRIVQALEQGVVPWVRPWDAGSTIPTNAVTKRPYRGVNVPLLWLAAMDEGYATDRWLTFQQAKKAGGHVKTGEKGVRVVFWKPVEIKKRDDGSEPDEEPSKRFVPLVRSFVVFNEAQIEGLPPVKEKPQIWKSEDLAEQYLSLADVQHGGDRAFYSPSRDQIQLPAKTNFHDTAGYYSTALHELVHWSGHEDRLDRLKQTPYGSPEYAREELIAEMGSAFLAVDTGIPGNLQHPEYLNHWLRVLREDTRAIFKAASQAQAALDFLKDLRGKVVLVTALERVQSAGSFRLKSGPEKTVGAVNAA